VNAYVTRGRIQIIAVIAQSPTLGVKQSRASTHQRCILAILSREIESKELDLSSTFRLIKTPLN
jgi:hypothetical protein